MPKKMSEIDSKLCKICLNNSTYTRFSSNTSLSKFFSYILGIHDSPTRIRLCAWCMSVLRKTAQLIRLAEESQNFLSNLKMNNITQEKLIENNRLKFFNLSLHHNNHNDIVPMETNKHKTNKSKKTKPEKIQHNAINETNVNINEIKIKNKIKVEEKIVLDVVKIEEVDMDERMEADNKFDDTNDVSEEQNKKEIDQSLYKRCEEMNFILKVLTLEEQKAELEVKKKCEKYLNRKYKCEYCAIGFVTKEIFEEHKKKHEESHSPHECTFCHLRLRNATVLTQHTLAHRRRFRCQLCAAVLCRYSECRYHRLKCGQPVPGVCPHCRKIFNNQNSLSQHIRGVHYKKEKMFACSFCDKRFQSRQRLAIHSRTHTGAKPYACDLCQRAFASSSNLRYHLAAHAQARPHYCVECDKSYKTRKGLRRHLLEGATHRGKNVHSCQRCLKNFATEKQLASHNDSVHMSDACGLYDKKFSASVNSEKDAHRVHDSPT